MANDLKITPDQLEEPMLDEGKVNVNLTLYDNQLEEMASRSSLYQHISETQNADVSFADLLADDSTTLQAYTDFYPDKPPETTLSLQSDTYGWYDFVVPTTDTEKNQLKAGLEDVASREHTSADAMMYEVFKEEWIADHIDDVTMTATEALYENSEESIGLTFEQYVQEYGFEDGSAPPSFAEFLENDYTERPAEQSQQMSSASPYMSNDFIEQPEETAPAAEQSDTSSTNNAYEQEYMLLDRLKSDCEYYLNTNATEENNHLWAGNPEAQIEKMQELYDMLPEKPEWLTQEDINQYAQQMIPEKEAEMAIATVQVRNMLVNEDGNLFATMEVNRSRMEELLNDANSPLLKGKDIHELVYFNDAASPILAAEINRDESVQVSAIMRDGYEEIEVPLSLDDNTIAEIKDAVKENVEQSLDVSVQHFFETAEPNHNYSQEEVHALAETVGKFVTAYQEEQEPEKEFSLEKNIQRIEEGLTSPEILPRLTAELDKAIDVSQRTTSEGIFLLPDRIVEQAVEVAQQMEMYTKPLGFEKNEIVQFDGEVIMDTETADGETKPTINLALYMTDDFMEQALDRAGIFDVNNPAYQADSFEELMFNEDGTFKTYVNGYIDISENKEVDFRLYTSGDAEINVPLSDSEKRVVLDKAEAYIEQETGMTFEQNIEDLRNSSNEWYAVKMDIGDTVNAFFENGGAEPTTSKSGTFTVAKAPEGEAIQLIDNDLKMSMAEMTPADNGYVIQNSINAIIKEGLENGLKRADMVASQEVQKEQPAPEKKHKQSIERD